MGSAPRRPSFEERLARTFIAREVSRLSQAVLMVVLLPAVLAISILIFIALGVVMFGSYALLGSPRPLAAIVSVAWFVGGLLILFLVLRRGYRLLNRLVDIADLPAALIAPPIDDEAVTVERPAAGEGPDPATYSERLAAADARIGTPSASHETLSLGGQQPSDGEPDAAP